MKIFLITTWVIITITICLPLFSCSDSPITSINTETTTIPTTTNQTTSTLSSTTPPTTSSTENLIQPPTASLPPPTDPVTVLWPAEKEIHPIITKQAPLEYPHVALHFFLYREVYSLTPTIEWYPYENSDYYNVEIIGFNMNFKEENITATQITLPDGLLKWDYLYELFVVAITPSGATPREKVEFATHEKPAPTAQPYLINPDIPDPVPGDIILEEPVQKKSPVENAYIKSITPELEWLPYNDAEYYTIWIRGKDWFDTFFITETTDTKFVVPEGYLLTNTSYHWVVTAHTPHGETTFKDFWNLHTIDHDVVDLAYKDLGTDGDNVFIKVANYGNVDAYNFSVSIRAEDLESFIIIHKSTSIKIDFVEAYGEVQIEIPLKQLIEELGLTPMNWLFYMTVVCMDDVDWSNNKYFTDHPTLSHELESFVIWQEQYEKIMSGN